MRAGTRYTTNRHARARRQACVCVNVCVCVCEDTLRVHEMLAHRRGSIWGSVCVGANASRGGNGTVRDQHAGVLRCCALRPAHKYVHAHTRTCTHMLHTHMHPHAPTCTRTHTRARPPTHRAHARARTHTHTQDRIGRPVVVWLHVLHAPPLRGVDACTSQQEFRPLRFWPVPRARV